MELNWIKIKMSQITFAKSSASSRKILSIASQIKVQQIQWNALTSFKWKVLNGLEERQNSGVV